MQKEDLRIKNEDKATNFFLEEMFKNSQSFVNVLSQKTDLSEMELISKVEEPYVSPIFSMSEDEILNFVEEFEVSELATLTTQELNHIGKVLGVDPKILVEGED